MGRARLRNCWLAVEEVHSRVRRRCRRGLEIDFDRGVVGYHGCGIGLLNLMVAPML